MNINDLLIGFEDIYESTLKSYFETRLGKLHLFMAGIFLGLAVLCFLILGFERMFTKKQKPWDVARGSLEEAWQKYNNHPQNVRELYFNLTEVVKFLIESRFKTKVDCKTDSEFLLILHSLGGDEQTKTGLVDLVSRAQSVKFANLTQMEEQVLRDVELIRSALKDWAEDAITKT